MNVQHVKNRNALLRIQDGGCPEHPFPMPDDKIPVIFLRGLSYGYKAIPVIFVTFHFCSVATFPFSFFDREIKIL
jgi:hypothetical protein